MGFLRRNAVALGALFVALAGGAYAATSGFVGPGGVISGCVPANGGKLTVVKSGRACPRGTLSLKFNQRGEPGHRGLRGATGKQGPPGSVLVAKAASTAHTASTTETTSSPCATPTLTTCPDSSNGAVVPVSGGSWSQPAQQFDIPYAQVVVTVPSQSTCSAYSIAFMFSEPGQMAGEVDDSASGTPLGTFTATAGATSTTQTMPVTVAPSFQRATALAHHITVKVADNCGTGGGTAVGTAHFTVDSFRLNEMGVS